MMRALYSAVSGMAGNMLRMDVIGNNIANVNTIGFKAGRLNFEEAFAQMRRAASAPGDNSGGTNPIQIGGGSMIGSASQLYTQGSLQMTGIGTDLAIQGNGLFVMSDGSANYYTRDGSFQIDSSGQLISPSSGFIVQGYAYDRTSESYASDFTNVQVPLHGIEPARETSQVTLSGNLNADSQPRGSLMETGVLYGSSGELASDATALVDLRIGATSTTQLVYDGDAIHMNAIVGGDSVTSELTVGSGTTIADFLSALTQMLNSGEGVEGITATIGADGRIEVETPDSMGNAASVTGLTLSALDDQERVRSEFSSAFAFDDLESARDASVFTKRTRIYDALGFAHEVTFTFTRVAGANEFTWAASTGTGTASVLEGGSGRVTFRNDGSVESFTFDSVGGTMPTELRVNPGTGAQGPVDITLDIGARGSFEGLTMLSGSTSVETNQDGYAQGNFTDFETDEMGRVMARFSNGVMRPIARLAVAEFINPAGLTRVGNNAYVENPNSGSPLVGAPGEGVIASSIAAGALEQSNVDLAQEFTDMVVAQRGFQANARVITASDEILTDLINIKR